VRVDDLNLQGWSVRLSNWVDKDKGTTHKVMGILEVAANSHLAAAVTVGHRPLAPIKSVGSPGSDVAAVCLSGSIVIHGS
jgi:hypothetical protein